MEFANSNPMHFRTVLLTVALTLSCTSSSANEAPVASPEFTGLRHLEDPSVHHFIQASPRILSGAAPEAGDEALYAALAKRGVLTIVSVDGARPDVETAARFGMRYLHIPFGYDGVPEDAALQIASAMEQTTGPIYFHCHHGQHRGPAAAAIALRLETGCSGPEAAELMRFAETDPKYTGLWRDIEAWTPPAKGTPRPTLHAIAPVGGFTAGMANLDRVWDRVRLIQAAAWTAPSDHPDLVPAHEAKILAEVLEALTGEMTAEQLADAEFARRMIASRQEAVGLQTALAAGDAAAAEQRFSALRKSCSSCHDLYRN
jgi:hypothetical protein